ncbi:MAG: response regulator [Oscillospiraceae bacterium]|nr:response regulator [Oscillospiraceae bacterium]
MRWFRNLRVGSKLLLSYLTIVVIVAGAGLFVMNNMRVINDAYSDAMEQTSRRVSSILDSKANLADARVYMRELLHVGNTEHNMVMLTEKLEESIAALEYSLNELYEIAFDQVREEVLRVLPVVAALREGIVDAVEILFKVQDFSAGNPEFIESLVEVERRMAFLEITYTNEIVGLVEEISGLAISILGSLAADNGAMADRSLLVTVTMIMASAMLFLAMAFYIPGTISKPIAALTEFMKKASLTGDMTRTERDNEIVDECYRYKDEISICIRHVSSFVWRMAEIEANLQKVAGGDLNADVEALSEVDTMGKSLRTMIDNLDGMFDKVRQSAAKAEAAAHAKSNFLANMSHEIRTPINAVIGMAKIGKASPDMERKDYCFKKVENASNHLLYVINDILDMSKIEADKFDLSNAEFEFDRLMRRVVDIVGFRANERGQRLCVRSVGKIPRFLVGDDHRLAQVMTNLLSNATKFTPEGGVITIETRMLGEEDGLCRLQVNVIDNGIGMDEEQKGRIFKSFEQAEQSTTRKFGGTGLGLSISKRIVELMGGEIWVDSKPGEGSTFSFTVSMQKGQKGVQIFRAAKSPAKTFRLLAVDDEPEVRRFFAETSEELGIGCDVASSGEEALDILRGGGYGTYDFYFFDWKLPGINGIELARRVHAESEEPPVTAVFSAIDWDVMKDEAKGMGIVKFLPKPLLRIDIEEFINSALEAGLEDDAEAGELADDYSGYKVLLAEDIEINREIVLALLEPTNIEVVCAENGSQALSLFEASPAEFDVILMDVQMPVMDGYEATKQIRSLGVPEATSVPIIAMTANVFRDDVESCLQAGMDDHIGKPIDFNDVMARMRKYLTMKQMRAVKAMKAAGAVGRGEPRPAAVTAGA